MRYRKKYSRGRVANADSLLTGTRAHAGLSYSTPETVFTRVCAVQVKYTSKTYVCMYNRVIRNFIKLSFSRVRSRRTHSRRGPHRPLSPGRFRNNFHALLSHDYRVPPAHFTATILILSVRVSGYPPSRFPSALRIFAENSYRAKDRRRRQLRHPVSGF